MREKLAQEIATVFEKLIADSALTPTVSTATDLIPHVTQIAV